MYRLLLVEDDFSLAQAMKEKLESYDYEVRMIEDFQQVLKTFVSVEPQLVLMDITLPFRDGYAWCREIRKVSNVPIVFISSASENMNIVMAINMGADDFIAKPVDPMVLCAKVNAVIRRTYELKEDSRIMEFHGAVLNLADYTIQYQDEHVELTKNEYRILQTLLDNRGKIVSRDRLMLALWQNDCFVEENTLTVNVARLRKKLDGCGLSDVIQTKTGSGYLLS